MEENEKQRSTVEESRNKEETNLEQRRGHRRAKATTGEEMRGLTGRR